jgi:arylsulfatase A-like enzyme
VRTEKYRYAEYDDNRGAMLFDEAADPHELKNLANDPEYKHVREELADLLHKTLPPLERH